MLIASFTLALIALTAWFDGWLDRQANPNRNPEFYATAEGAREVVLRRNSQGHYLADGLINDVPVTFLLDTGATDVAIPAELARQAGLARGFANRAATAGGVVTVYSTIVDKLVLGNIVLSNISASITPTMAGETILLGMSALKELEFTQRGPTLTIRHYASY